MRKSHLVYIGLSATALLLTLTSIRLNAIEHEIFDGRNYNGKFYPRIDIIEWNEESLPSHMEFQNYHYGKMPVEMAFELEEKGGGRKVMLVRYKFTSRGEELCRRVVAPDHFKQGFIVYKETDKDREITYVSMVPLPEKKGRKQVNSGKYASCGMPKEERSPASEEKPDPENEYANGLNKGIDPNANNQKRVPGAAGALKGKGQAVPFSDW